jgi:competence protein ComEC
MTGGVFFPLAPLFVFSLLLFLSFLLYREFQNVPAGVVLPWPWIFVGFFWTVSHSFIPDSRPIPSGSTVFHGCLAHIRTHGPKTFTGVFLASFQDGRSGDLLLSIPAARLGRSPEVGECFVGDVLLSDHPDGWNSRYGFLSFLDNGTLQGQIRPWNVFVPELGQRQSIGWGRFLNWAPARVASLEAVLENQFPSDVSGLIESMVLSDTSHVSAQMSDLFLNSGVYHLLSVSGEHMGLLVAFLSGAVLLCIRFLPLGVLRRILARIFISRLLAAMVIPVLIIYTILIGMPLPAGRALLAASFILLTRGWGASLHREDLFGISVIAMMIFTPDLPRSMSMDLSIMAVLGILVSLRKDEGSPRRDLSGVVPPETLKAGLWVTLFTTPLLWGVFNVGDLVGILSNPVIVPLAGELILPAGFAYLGMVFFFGWASSALSVFLKACSRAVIGLATFFSGIRLGQISLPPLPPVFLLAFNGWLLGLFLRKKHSGSPGSDVFPLLIVIFPILVLSVSEHLLYGDAVKRTSGKTIEVMPALVHQSALDPVALGRGTVSFDGWFWIPQMEARNLARLVQLQSGDTGGR